MWQGLLVITLGTGVVSSLMLLAEADKPTFGDAIPPWIVGGGSVLFTVWFSWYTVTKTIPDMQEKHAEFVKVMRKDFMDTILALEQRHEAYTGKSETEFRLDLAEILKLAREERDRSREDMAAYVKSRQDDQARFEAILERAGQQLGCKFVSGERHGA